jgi:DNA polymerase I-like protein with 3'-5' exonuclease and polymerase domains
MNWESVVTENRFNEILNGWQGPLACDTETHPDHLLGISLSPLRYTNNIQAIYIPITHYDKETRLFQDIVGKASWLFEWFNDELALREGFIGHNFTYDKGVLKRHLDVETYWVADTRIMWHLASAPEGPRPYGLKDAQVELLGWDKRGDVELSDNVKRYGGSLKKGEHYLADIAILAKYAALDAYATVSIYKQLSPFFQGNDYWPMLCTMMEYNELLEKNTQQGAYVDLAGLQASHNRLLRVKEAAYKRFYKELKNDIESLEKDWADRKIAKYKREYNKVRYENHPEEWERFNINSDSHKRELFYDKLRFPISSTTESGKPSVDGDSIRQFNGSFVEAYLKYEKANTLTSNFSGPYITSCSGSVDGRLHPGFNICGTVSYRLSGFKPYLLNAPFDEKIILKNFMCDEGWVGVHADLSAIEPTITAHYSEDPNLLKVFRDGLGDIYLDLALELFPKDKELQNGYSPRIPITKAIKERFAKQRKIAKVIQLAVQYTGTGHTVSKSLTKTGIPTTVWEANNYVRAYWRKFEAVFRLNDKLQKINRKQGYLRNVIGRIIRVPHPDYKDLPNRFIQSSAHDVLILWALEIYKICTVKGVEVRPILLDCHDSTSNQFRATEATTGANIYKEALENINKQLDLCVTIKADIKQFKTLAGLKGEE